MCVCCHLLCMVIFFSEMPEKYVLLCFGQLHAEDFFFFCLVCLFVCECYDIPALRSED